MGQRKIYFPFTTHDMVPALRGIFALGRTVQRALHCSTTAARVSSTFGLFAPRPNQTLAARHVLPSIPALSILAKTVPPTGKNGRSARDKGRHRAKLRRLRANKPDANRPKPFRAPYILQ
jgi:hypothetical protein